MALANTFWIDVYRAQLDDYARKVSEFAQIAERAGITSDHPLVNQIAALAVDGQIYHNGTNNITLPNHLVHFLFQYCPNKSGSRTIFQCSHTSDMCA